MKEKTQQELYTSISDPIMDLRIKIKQGKVKDFDEELYLLSQEIWRLQTIVLGISDWH